RKRKKRWDVASTPAEEEPAQAEGAKPKRSRWDQAPALLAPGQEAPKKKSRWDQAPSATPAATGPGATPVHPSQAGATPLPPPFTGDPRNAPISDEELDLLLPGEDKGYKVLVPPPGYEPVRAPA